MINIKRTNWDQNATFPSNNGDRDKRHIMSKKIESITVSDNAKKAAKKMRDKNVSSLVVVDKDTHNLQQGHSQSATSYAVFALRE